MSTPSQPKHSIFISHSHIDNEFGTILAQDLSRVLGDESAVWYDVLGGLHGGDTWWEKILEELTARNVFIVVLSPEAAQSKWVRDEINLAWKQKNSREGKQIIPLLYRECSVRADLDTLQVISFLSPRTYETSFKEILMTLGLPTAGEEKPVRIAPQPVDIGTALVQQMEVAFANQDWPDVIRKANYLIKNLPGSATATVYRLLGLALLEEGEAQQGQETLETALALVSDRQLRLTLLGDYTTLLAGQNQWAKVLKQAKEALRLVPNDPGWLATQAQAQSQLAKASPIQLKSQTQMRPKDKETPSVPQKTKEQWFNEGFALNNLKRYDEALAAYEQAIRINPNYADAYHNKGEALLKLKRYDEALAAYEQAIRLDPNYANAYHNKGLALDNLGKSAEAKQAHDKARQLGYTG
jgi:tetratricopeptide (TPR) repeat protein